MDEPLELARTLLQISTLPDDGATNVTEQAVPPDSVAVYEVLVVVPDVFCVSDMAGVKSTARTR